MAQCSMLRIPPRVTSRDLDLADRTKGETDTGGLPMARELRSDSDRWVMKFVEREDVYIPTTLKREADYSVRKSQESAMRKQRRRTKTGR